MNRPPQESAALPPAWRRAANRWRVWSDASVNRRVFSATAVLCCLTLLVKVVAMARDIVVAKTFGAGDAMDAFAMAFAVNTYTVTLLMSSINYSLVPTFIRARETAGQSQAQLVLSNVMVLGLAALLLCGVALAAASRPMLDFLAQGFSAPKLHLAEILFLMLLPAMVLSGITSTGAAILNSEKRFILVGITPILTPAIAGATLLLWPAHDANSGVKRLAGAICAGFFCEFLVILLMLARRGYSLRPRWTGLDPGTREILAQCGWRITAAMLLGGIPLVEQATAARLGTGSVALLNYSNKLLAVVLGIGATSLGTVVFPHFSHAIAVNDWDTVRRMVRKYTRLIFILSLPVIGFLSLFAEPVVRLLFERGAFTHESTLQVSRLQVIYSLQIPFYVLGFLYAPLISALNASGIMVWGNAISLALSVALNFFLARWLGIIGVAAASGAVYLCSALFLRTVLGWRFKHVFRSDERV